MRCYNGCPDDELAAVWKANDDAHAALAAAGLKATYFPLEGKWMVSTRLDSGVPWREVTGFHNTLVEAVRVALRTVAAEAAH